MRCLTFLLSLAVMGSCTPGDARSAREANEYRSMATLTDDLEAQNADWSCEDEGAMPGYIGGPNEIAAAQCTLDENPSTVHIFEPGSAMPTIRKTDNGPHVWWVSGPNWYVATTSEDLTDDIQDALGGTVSTSRSSG